MADLRINDDSFIHTLLRVICSRASNLPVNWRREKRIPQIEAATRHSKKDGQLRLSFLGEGFIGWAKEECGTFFESAGRQS